MAAHEAAHADIYDPVRLSPEGSLLNRIVLEKLWDKYHGDCLNPDNGEPFNISDIQPQVQLRNQLRQGIVGQEEYYPGQLGNSLEHWKVIPDYPFQFLDEDHMRDYVNKLSRWIADGVRTPQDMNALWKAINLLRLNCQYSHANAGLFHSVDGFKTLIGALESHFYRMGLKNLSHHRFDIVGMEDTVNLCREIVMLVEILGSSRDRPSLSEALCGIMRILYFEGGYKKDTGRIVGIIHARLYDLRLPLFDNYFNFIYLHLQDPSALSTELSLCADVINLFYSEGPSDNPPSTILPLSKALGTLVSRFCDEDLNNNKVIEEYGDRCVALEKVMKVMCRLCAKYGLQTVSYMSRTECGVLGQIRKILKYALLLPRPGAGLFNGRHLLFALLLTKYLYNVPGLFNARLQDVKTVFDFAMSDLATRYLFNGRPILKDLADKLVSTNLTSNTQCAQLVFDNWPNLNM